MTDPTGDALRHTHLDVRLGYLRRLYDEAALLSSSPVDDPDWNALQQRFDAIAKTPRDLLSVEEIEALIDDMETRASFA
jgi:hypothetical protein